MRELDFIEGWGGIDGVDRVGTEEAGIGDGGSAGISKGI